MKATAGTSITPAQHPAGKQQRRRGHPTPVPSQCLAPLPQEFGSPALLTRQVTQVTSASMLTCCSPEKTGRYTWLPAKELTRALAHPLAHTDCRLCVPGAALGPGCARGSRSLPSWSLQSSKETDHSQVSISPPALRVPLRH